MRDRAATPRAFIRGAAIRLPVSMLLVLAVVTSIAGLRVASASPPPVTAVDLRAHPKATLIGAVNVSPAGDVNGDDKPDVVVSDCGTEESGSVVWVLFGPLEEERLDLREADAVQGKGFRIIGAPAEPGTTYPDAACNLARGGDVNGDGSDDLLIGASGGDPLGRSSAGTVYVVFGKANDADVHLQSFDEGRQGDAGFRIDGPYPRSHAGGGGQLTGTGDMNGDGLADLAVAAPLSGSAYVVFGKADPLPVDLLSFDAGPTPAGFRVDFPPAESSDRISMGAPGDANGDGTPDLALRLGSNDRNAGVYVVFGKGDPLPVDARDLDDDGYRIKPPRLPGGRSIGATMASLGDLNGDGRDDMVLSAAGIAHYSPEGEVRSIGWGFVVFGHDSPAPVQLSARGDWGYPIRATQARRPPGDGSGNDVGSAGDVNGDGLEDLLINAYAASFNSRHHSGSTYLVYGKATTKPISLRRLGTKGIRFDGPRAEAITGVTVAGVGDVLGGSSLDVAAGSSGDHLARIYIFPAEARP